MQKPKAPTGAEHRRALNVSQKAPTGGFNGDCKRRFNSRFNNMFIAGASPVGPRGALHEHFNRLFDAAAGFHMAYKGQDLRGLGAELTVGLNR